MGLKNVPCCFFSPAKLFSSQRISRYRKHAPSHTGSEIQREVNSYVKEIYCPAWIGQEEYIVCLCLVYCFAMVAMQFLFSFAISSVAEYEITRTYALHLQFICAPALKGSMLFTSLLFSCHGGQTMTERDLDLVHFKIFKSTFFWILPPAALMPGVNRSQYSTPKCNWHYHIKYFSWI